MVKLAIAAVAAALLLAAAPAPAEPVRTANGLVDGVGSDGITSYKGIPFATPPVGDLRWRAPEPSAVWNGVLRADHFAPICPQAQVMNAAIGLPTLPMNEDCLYLNVWTPTQSPSARLPVMVWIYGGGFTGGGTGFPIYDGTNLAKRGVVVVSLAYRIGALGYLAHPELDAESPAHASGTYGLMDLIAGLKWVKANAAAFGGDPDNVTIFGESAGAIAVSILCASPKAKGLFAKAISESGGSFAPAKRTGHEGGMNVPSLTLAESQGEDFLAKLGAKTIADARKVSADDILKAQGPALGAFWPALDGDILPGDQYRLYEAGRYNDVPVLIGTNADEGSLFVRETTPEKFAANVRAAYGDHAGRILDAYPAKVGTQALRSARDLFRDTAFAWHTWSWARLQSRTGKSKVFVYYFTHRPPYPPSPMFKDLGASHGADVLYVFGNATPAWNDADKSFSDQVMTYWTNFAKTGDPNGSVLTRWPAFDERTQQVLQLDVTPNAIAVPNIEQLETLDGYYAWRRSEEP
jgi:para-nitrobenzyl esterase